MAFEYSAAILGSRFCPRGSNPAAGVLQSGGKCHQSHPSKPEPGKQSSLFSIVIKIPVLACLLVDDLPLAPLGPLRECPHSVVIRFHLDESHHRSSVIFVASL